MLGSWSWYGTPYFFSNVIIKSFAVYNTVLTDAQMLAITNAMKGEGATATPSIAPTDTFVPSDTPTGTLLATDTPTITPASTATSAPIETTTPPTETPTPGFGLLTTMTYGDIFVVNAVVLVGIIIIVLLVALFILEIFLNRRGHE